MPRTGRRHPLTVAAAVLATLATPVAAQAATYTVGAGQGACGGADTGCESLVAAAAVAAAGDTVSVAPGTYAEAPNFTAANVRVSGAAAGVAITGSITFSGNGATPSVLEKVVVLPSSAGSTAVDVTGSAGVAVRDSLIGSTGGIGMTIANGSNEITRTTVVSGGGDAVLVQPGTAATSLTMDTSVLSGGASGAGLRVTTGVSQLPAPGSAGNATITAQHITVAGSANGIVLDSSAATPLTTAVGNIEATVSDSIVLGASPTSNNAGIPSLLPGILPAVAPPNAATLTFTNTERTTAAAALFLNPAKRNFHLRPDATSAIDKASAPGPSPTDIDGQPRTAGAASDLGADEFVNEAPKAVIEIKTSPQRTGRPVAFDGSKSSDRETGAGGGIVRYHWEFGDGQSADTTTPTTTHTYAGEGDATAKLTVVDAQGASSNVASVALKLIDGSPPVIVITKPNANQKIKLTTRTTRTRTVTVDGVRVRRRTTTTKRTKIAFAGTAKDKSGVKGVLLTVERLSRTPTAATARSSSATATKRCTWIDPKKGAVLRSCAKPVLILAKLATDGTWTFSFKSTLKLAAGLYRVAVAGQDNAGVAGNAAALGDAIHRFRLVR